MPRKPAILLPLLLAFAIAASVDAADKTPEPARQQYYIGVGVESIPPLMSRQLKLQDGQGLNIQRIIPDSPAANAKLLVGDLLITVNDEPLKSQEQLNKSIHDELVDGKWQPKPIVLGYLREGERLTVTLNPAVRPPQLLAIGPASNISGSAAPKSYVGTDGVMHVVGPGYLVDTHNTNASVNKSLRALTVNGQTIILSQEADATGKVKTTVTFDNKTTEVDPNHLELLPEDLRNLLTPLFAPAEPAPTPPQPTEAQTMQQMQDKLKAQEQQIQDLQNKLNELLKKKP